MNIKQTNKRMFFFLVFVCIGSNFFQLISGLNLTSPNEFMPTTGFTFICKVQGIINTAISVSDPLGSTAAACFQPPNGCGSSAGNTFNRNIADGTFTVDIVQSNVHTTNSKGNWTCTDGINVARFDVKEIVSFTNPMIWLTEAANGKMIMVLFECIYPYPEIKISYVKKSTLAHVSDTENGGIFSNGTSVNCPVADARAISVNGTFPLSTRQFKEDTVVAVTIILNGIKLPTIYSNITIPSTNGLTIPSSSISSDLSTTVSEHLSIISSNMPTTPTTVSEAPFPSNTTSSAGLSQEIMITITISSILAAGVLIFLIVLVVKLCRKKDKNTLAKNKENRFANKQGNFSKKDAFKSSIEPRKPKLLGKRNAKQESFSLNEFQHTQFKNSEAPKDRMYEHYPQTTDYMYINNSGNQHVFNHSHAERSLILYGNQHDRYPKSHSGPNNRIEYQSHYPEHSGHNEGMFQYYRADQLYRGQQMYQGPYVTQYDHHIKNKPENKRRYEGRTYERNWDFLY